MGLDLPKVPTTLLNTPKDCEVKQMGQGSYNHFGLASATISELKMTNEHKLTADTLNVLVKVDGLPLSRSSNIQLWPDLGQIVELLKWNLFIAGLCKPKSASNYMHDFVQDI